ncbi:hypothetical protein [Kibdelosporangium aridum]|uniref:hypothetical protein n=1 Tax=Kibdelosporangium aridum TaxID=2030 RepID=UPI00117A76C7|nr:hypothetical protein [Kibdelosporangium aridum]
MGALWFTDLSLQATREQMRTTEQGQYADRFTKGVEQLWSQQAVVRLGAVLELKSLADESVRDAVKVVRVLSSFVRSRTPMQGCLPAGFVADGARGSTRLPDDVAAALEMSQQLSRSTNVNLATVCSAEETAPLKPE